MDVECIHIYIYSFYRYLSTGISFFDKMCITFNVCKGRTFQVIYIEFCLKLLSKSYNVIQFLFFFSYLTFSIDPIAIRSLSILYIHIYMYLEKFLFLFFLKFQSSNTQSYHFSTINVHHSQTRHRCLRHLSKRFPLRRCFFHGLPHGCFSLRAIKGKRWTEKGRNDERRSRGAKAEK